MQQSNRQDSKSREDRKTVARAEEYGASAGEDLEEEKGDNTRTNNDDDRQHTTIKHLSHLDDTLQTRIYALIRKYWSVFDDRGSACPSKIMSVLLTQATLPPLQSRISATDQKKSLS